MANQNKENRGRQQQQGGRSRQQEQQGGGTRQPGEMERDDDRSRNR